MRKRLSPPQMLALGFLSFILIGTILLSLPFSSRECALVDALFTATSAVCVTGLIVKDIPNDFTYTKEFAGKSGKEIQLRNKYGVNLIAIKRKVVEAGAPKDIWNVNPSPTDIMGEGDILVLIGTNEDLSKLTG